MTKNSFVVEVTFKYLIHSAPIIYNALFLINSKFFKHILRIVKYLELLQSLENLRL